MLEIGFGSSGEQTTLVHLKGGSSNFGITVSNYRIENNTFYEPNSSVGFWVYGGSLTDGSVIFRNNIVVIGPATVLPRGVTHSNNIFQFLSASSRITAASNSPGAGEKIADPLFVNAGGYDFHLRGGSPAINTGSNLDYPVDFENRAVPSGAAPDIGAFESLAGPGSPLPNPPPVVLPPPIKSLTLKQALFSQYKVKASQPVNAIVRISSKLAAKGSNVMMIDRKALWKSITRIHLLPKV